MAKTKKLPANYLAFKEEDGKIIDQLLAKKLDDVAIGYTMIVLKYIGKDYNPFSRITGHHKQSQKFDRTFVKPEHDNGRKVLYIYFHVDGKNFLFEALETLLIDTMNFFPETSLLNDNSGQNVVELLDINSNFRSEYRFSILVYLLNYKCPERLELFYSRIRMMISMMIWLIYSKQQKQLRVRVIFVNGKRHKRTDYGIEESLINIL